MLRLFEMFSGYGGASFALKKADIPFVCVGYSEIDKYAIKCYDQNHTTGKNFGDCTKIEPNELPDFDLLTGGFPCQAFSLAGKGLGELDTRGTLFREIIRIAEIKKPKYMLLENVKGLTTKKHKATFEKILSELNRIGYDVQWKVLNSKKHGIPQNRERAWFVCKLGTWEFNEFQFPEEETLKIFVKDILDEKVDEKYNLSEKQIKAIQERLKDKNQKRVQFDISGKGHNSQQDRVYNAEGSLPCIPSTRTDNKVNIFSLQPRNPDRPSLKNGTSSGGSGQLIKSDGTTYCCDTANTQAVCLSINLGTIRRGEYGDGLKDDGTHFTVTSSATDLSVAEDYMFRRLTPRECFRLMGFLKDEIKLDGLSDTQCYKLAGNGWEINVVSKIFKELFKGEKNGADTTPPNL